MLDGHVLAVHAVVDVPHAHASFGLGVDSGDVLLPQNPLDRVRQMLPHQMRRGRGLDDCLKGGLGTRDEVPIAFLLERPSCLQVLNPHRDVSDIVVVLGVWHEAENGGVHRHRLEGRRRVHGIGGLADHVTRRSLRQPVEQDHVGAGQFLGAGDVAHDVFAVVDEELQVETGDSNARIALAGGGVGDIPQAFLESEVGGLDRIHYHGRADRLGIGVGESGVALQFREREDRLDRLDDRLQQVGDDILGVHELGAGHVGRVAGDVGEQQTASVRCPHIHPVNHTGSGRRCTDRGLGRLRRESIVPP